MRNFGEIKTIVNDYLIETYNDENSMGKKLFKEYLKTLNESETLKSQYFVFSNIEERYLSSEIKIKRYISENVNFLKKLDIISENKKLEDLLVKYGVDDRKVDNKLHESIHTIITTDRTPLTINKVMDATAVVTEHIINNVPTIKEDITPVDQKTLIDIAVTKYNEKYGTLSEEERELVKTLINTKDKETLFNTTIKENIDVINDKLIDFDDIDVRTKLKETKEKLNVMSYNEETFISDMTKVHSLNSNLKEM